VTNILGISAFYHDSAATLLTDGEIIAAAQEERFTRVKHDSSYPYNAVEFVLQKGNIKLNEVDYIVFYEKPFLKFERLLETYLAFAPRGFKSFSMSMPIWLREKLFQKKYLFDKLKMHDLKFSSIDKIHFSEHHFSHAASAFYPSPFKDAAILTLDGVGEWATTTLAIGNDNKLKILKEMHFPHSIGLLYSAFTYYLGFKVNSGEYKVMGLAPYGSPKYEELILKNLVHLKNDGTFRLNLKYFNYATGLTMINKNFIKLFGKEARDSKQNNIEKFHMDIAASIQKVTEKIVINLVNSIKKENYSNNLCLAGGVALNCVANGKILKSRSFKNIWIQPAAGDAGGSLGAAIGFWHKELKKDRKIKNDDSMKGSYLGPSYSNSEVENTLKNIGAKYHFLDDMPLIERVSKYLIEQKIIGWFQGRMEFGPRALGSRSIIADPRSEDMQKKLNLKIKFRESFRPFAPAIIIDKLKDWFEIDVPSPYMLMVSEIKQDKRINIKDDQKKLFGIDLLKVKRSIVPAVTHVDYSARIQTVDSKTNKKFYNLLAKFNELSECPILVNTSFNIRGEPIVCSVEDAFNCFMGTNIDILVCENFLLLKNEQLQASNIDYKDKFKLD
tara:strand:+ start:485 stop:2323 length:1839 start_codon:yes stop_codon:yes gene_type:complete